MRTVHLTARHFHTHPRKLTICDDDREPANPSTIELPIMATEEVAINNLENNMVLLFILLEWGGR